MSVKGSLEWRENIRQGILRRIKTDPDFLVRRGKAIAASDKIRPRTTRSHCRKGHEMSFKNTAVTSDGYFRCRACWHPLINRLDRRDKSQQAAE